MKKNWKKNILKNWKRNIFKKLKKNILENGKRIFLKNWKNILIKERKFLFLSPLFVNNKCIARMLMFGCFDNVPILFQFHRDPLTFQYLRWEP